MKKRKTKLEVTYYPISRFTKFTVIKQNNAEHKNTD